MSENDHKLFELSIGKHGFHFRRENPHPLSAEQKFAIAMALIGLAAFLGFFGLLTVSSAIKAIGR